MEPPKRVVKAETSKCPIVAIPLLPSHKPFQVGATVLPRGVTAPTPVITTLLLDKPLPSTTALISNVPIHAIKKLLRVTGVAFIRPCR
jgi:hypothetical protein